MKATGDTTTRHDDGDRRHNIGKGQHGNMRHNDGDRRQHGNEGHDDKAKQGRRATRQRGTTMATGCTTTARGSMVTCGTTTAAGSSTTTARGSRATGGTTTVTGDIRGGTTKATHGELLRSDILF
jgi:hypothetical protein